MKATEEHRVFPLNGGWPDALLSHGVVNRVTAILAIPEQLAPKCIEVVVHSECGRPTTISCEVTNEASLIASLEHFHSRDTQNRPRSYGFLSIWAICVFWALTELAHTKKGLRVIVDYNLKMYATKRRLFPDYEDMRQRQITAGSILPKLNYTIKPTGQM